MMYRSQLLTLGLFLIFSYTLSAQVVEKRIATIILKDGSELVGEVILENDVQLVLESQSLGKVNILRQEITLVAYGVAFEGKAWRETLDDVRNIVGPGTGYNLPKGRGYYQNYMLFVNEIYYGITDNFSLGLGVELVTLFDFFIDFPTVGIFPKYTIPIAENKASVGLGAILLSTPDTRSAFDLNIFYGAFTYGPRGRNISFGLGYVMNEGELNSAPVFSIGAQYRVSSGMALTAESWFGRPMSGGAFSAGVRLIGKRRTSWDISLVGVAFDGEAVVSPLPLVGLTVPF
ncbi:MAG: hypothetical protein KDD01_00785 [Phaeodactylibacter sp.]|nr:hypothetical protein [Phaeodactylibacter sp.]